VAKIDWLHGFFSLLSLIFIQLLLRHNWRQPHTVRNLCQILPQKRDQVPGFSYGEFVGSRAIHKFIKAVFTRLMAVCYTIATLAGTFPASKRKI